MSTLHGNMITFQKTSHCLFSLGISSVPRDSIMADPPRSSALKFLAVNERFPSRYSHCHEPRARDLRTTIGKRKNDTAGPNNSFARSRLRCRKLDWLEDSGHGCFGEQFASSMRVNWEILESCSRIKRTKDRQIEEQIETCLRVEKN